LSWSVEGKTGSNFVSSSKMERFFELNIEGVVSRGDMGHRLEENKSPSSDSSSSSSSSNIEERGPFYCIECD
jgi:hypothetical protein